MNVRWVLLNQNQLKWWQTEGFGLDVWEKQKEARGSRNTERASAHVTTLQQKKLFLVLLRSSLLVPVCKGNTVHYLPILIRSVDCVVLVRDIE